MTKVDRSEVIAAICVLLCAVPVIWIAAHVSGKCANRRAEKIGDCEAVWVSSIAARGKDVSPTNWPTYRAHYNLGKSLWCNGKPLEAVKRWRYVMERAPKGSLPWVASCVMLGVAAERIGDQDRADWYYAKYMREACPVVFEARTQTEHGWRTYRKNVLKADLNKAPTDC